MILDLVIKFLLYFCAAAALIMFLPGNILLDISPKTFKHPLPKSLNHLTPLEQVKLSEFKTIGPLNGPESIAIFNGSLVTGTADGCLYQILSDDTTNKLLCLHSQTQDSRPLGLQFDSKGELFVTEPSVGIFQVSGVFGADPVVKLAMDIRATNQLNIGNGFIDDVAVEEKPNGYIFYMSYVGRRPLEDYVITLFGSEAGYILQYDTETKKIETLAKDLLFPNGVQLTTNNKALLYIDFSARDVFKYHLKGSKKGATEKIYSNLPGEPDNIRKSYNKDTYWIATLKPRTLLEPSDFDYFMKKPLLRKFVGRVSHLIGTILAQINKIYKSDSIAVMAHQFKTLQFGFHETIFPSKGGSMIEIDDNGTILNSIYTVQSDKLDYLSEVREVESQNPNERVFYLGSFKIGYARKLVISK